MPSTRADILRSLSSGKLVLPASSWVFDKLSASYKCKDTSSGVTLSEWMEGGARELLVRHAAGLPLEIHYRTKSGDWVYNYTLETARKVADYSYHTPDIREHGIEIKSRNVREDEIRGRTPRIIIGVQVEVAKASGEIRGHILYVVRSDDLLQWADDHHAWRPDKYGNPWMYAPVSFSSAERKRLWERAISS